MSLKPNNMAQCIKCKKSVGCGCNLNKEGLCATCAQKKREAEQEQLTAAQQNIIINNVTK